MTMAATSIDEVSDDDYPWDLSKMPIAPGVAATDDALAALAEANPDQRATVRRVRELLAGDRPERTVVGADWARALQHAPDVVAVTFSSGGFDEVSWDNDRSTFVVAGFSALREIHGDDPHYCEAAGRDHVKEVLHGCPRAITVDEAVLLGRDEGGDE